MYLKQKNETRMTPCTGTSSVLVTNRAEGEALGNESMFQDGFQIQKLTVWPQFERAPLRGAQEHVVGSRMWQQ